MSVYFISMVLSDSDDSWRQAYHEHVPAMITKYKGEIVATTRAVTQIEGSMPAPESISVIRFPSQEDLNQFMNAEEYQPFKTARQRTAETEIFTFEFED